MQQVVAQIPWGHNIVLMDKVADLNVTMQIFRCTQEYTPVTAGRCKMQLAPTYEFFLEKQILESLIVMDLYCFIINS